MGDTIPKDLSQLRACLSCSLVKSFEQFENSGCDNCEPFLNMKNNRDNVYDCTSTNFDGLIGAAKPEDSWVCKWQRISRDEKQLRVIRRFKKGVYAVSVSGQLPAAIEREMRSANISHRSRDTSKR